jgi:hypothetical protein
MSELMIRETLVFGGAVAGAIWGYVLGRFLERRRIAADMVSTLEALERWAIQVGRGLEGLEQSLALVQNADTALGLRADRPVLLDGIDDRRGHQRTSRRIDQNLAL